MRRHEASAAEEFPPTKPALSLWEEVLAADSEYRDEPDETGRISFASVASGLQKISALKGEWAGIPMPMNGEMMVIEPSYPFADALAKVGMATPTPSLPRRNRSFSCHIDENEGGPRIRNVFWSTRYRADVTVAEENGKVYWYASPGGIHIDMDIHTMGCHQAWSLEAEFTALAKLRDLLGHHKFRMYLMTGMFLETSARSKLLYIFRRLRPTVVISSANDKLRVLATLCLHPIAYYSGTWAGAMVPTDDVIAHLMLMRGDEKLFWRRANQHRAHRPESGL